MFWTQPLILCQMCYKQVLYMPSCTIPGAQPHRKSHDDTSSAKGKLPTSAHSACLREKLWICRGAPGWTSLSHSHQNRVDAVWHTQLHQSPPSDPSSKPGKACNCLSGRCKNALALFTTYGMDAIFLYGCFHPRPVKWAFYVILHYVPGGRFIYREMM